MLVCRRLLRGGGGGTSWVFWDGDGEEGCRGGSCWRKCVLMRCVRLRKLVVNGCEEVCECGEGKHDG